MAIILPGLGWLRMEVDFRKMPENSPHAAFSAKAICLTVRFPCEYNSSIELGLTLKLGANTRPQFLQSLRRLPCFSPFLTTLFEPQKKQIFPIKRKIR